MPKGETATLSSRFQISTPKSVRSAMDWKAGQKFAFIPKGRSVLLVPVMELDDLPGLARGADPRRYRGRDDRY